MKQMTLDEKIDYVGGDCDGIRGIPRLGIPKIMMSDGPMGCRCLAEPRPCPRASPWLPRGTKIWPGGRVLWEGVPRQGRPHSARARGQHLQVSAVWKKLRVYGRGPVSRGHDGCPADTGHPVSAGSCHGKALCLQQSGVGQAQHQLRSGRTHPAGDLPSCVQGRRSKRKGRVRDGSI